MFYGTCIDFFRCFARRRDQVIRHRNLFWLRLKHNSRGWACLHVVSLTHTARLLQEPSFVSKVHAPCQMLPGWLFCDMDAFNVVPWPTQLTQHCMEERPAGIQNTNCSLPFPHTEGLLQSVRLNMCLASKISVVKYHATISTHRQISFRRLWHLGVQKSWSDFLVNQSMSTHSSHCLLGDTYGAPCCFFF